MDTEVKRKKLMVVTRRLIILAAISVVMTAILFLASFFLGKHLMISFVVFECGLIGGFVSIQQRLHRIDDEELSLLRESWATILMIPIFGGIFALVLYVLFISGLVRGHLFPSFYVPDFSEPPTSEDVRAFVAQTTPKTGMDVAKLIFWSFAAGFSERLVPQIVGKMSKDRTDLKQEEPN